MIVKYKIVHYHYVIAQALERVLQKGAYIESQSIQGSLIMQF